MLKSFLNSTLRNAAKSKFHTALNVSSLAAGFFVCMLIFLHITDELSYDKFNENASQIYRVTYKNTLSSAYDVHFARHPFNWVLKLESEIPEVKELVRFHQARQAISYKDKKFYEDRLFFTDPEVFKVFSIKFLKGSPEGALTDPMTIVITQSMAKKYFGYEDPIGKSLNLLPKNQAENKIYSYKVTGVIEDVPANSHFHYDFLVNHFLPKDSPVNMWNYVYVQLVDGTTPENFEDKIPDFIRANWSDYNPDFHKIVFQLLPDIHLHSNLDRELEKNSDIMYVYILSAIAVLILFIASINYINLSTAKSFERSKEIGIRKILGAQKKDMILYFLGESVMISLSACILSVFSVILLLPTFNSLVHKSLNLNLLNDPGIILVLCAAAIVVGLAAGLYPALLISSVDPLNAITQTSTRTQSALSNIKAWSGRFDINRIIPGSLSIRKILIIFQFTISLILIICTLVINSQLDFMHNKDIGMRVDNIIAIPNLPTYIKDKFETFNSVLADKPGVIDVSAQMEIPSREILDAGQVFAEGKTNDGDQIFFYIYPVWGNYIDFMGLDLMLGRSFTPGSIVDYKPEYILNEAAVKLVGWDSPQEALNKAFSIRDLPRGNVIGVVKDFNNSTLKKKVKPFAYLVRPIWNSCFLVKIESVNTASTIEMLSAEWSILFPEYPFEYYFADELHKKLYAEDETFALVIGGFSIFAIIISCFGLLGLSALTTVQRTREIGIRKVLGSTPLGIVLLIFKDFLNWIIVANIVAWPTAYYLMERWLEQFAYRTEMEWSSFLLAGTLALMISLLTVGFQSMKTALANPVDSLRHE